MSMQKGFDAAGESDALDRESFARRIYEALTSVQPDWSVRVALYGSWGLGKTTIADWIMEWSKASGHIPIMLKVGAESSETIWHTLVEAIDKGLGEAGVSVQRGTIDKTIHYARKKSKAVSQAANLAPSISAGGVSAGGALLAGVSNLLRFSENDLKNVRQALGKDKRLVVLIDDLDRIDGAILPRVLLAVRDLLDVSGFSFLLPLDDNVVTKVIDKYTGIAGSGEGFLDKIADFHFRLPPLSKAQKVRFLEDLLAKSAPFLPASLPLDLAEILPNTPRRLKSIARHLAILSGVVARFDSEEINWKRVVFALLLRQEHGQFAQLFFDDYVATYNPYSDLISRGTEGVTSKQEQQFKDLTARAQLAVDEIEPIKRMYDFFWRNSDLKNSGQELTLSVQLLDAPPAFTPKELHKITECLFSDKLDKLNLLSALSRLGAHNALSFGLMVGALRQRYYHQFSLIVHAFSAEESAEQFSEATETLLAFKRLSLLDLSEIDGAGFALFDALFEVAKSFRVTEPALDKLFDLEDEVLLQIAQAASDADLLKIDLLLQDDDLDIDELKDRTQLVRKMMQGLAERECKLVIKRFETPNFADHISSLPHKAVFVRIFADSQSVLWKGSSSEHWHATLRKAAGNTTVQRNAFDCLTKLSNLLSQPASISGQTSSLIKDVGALSELCAAATARPFSRLYQNMYLRSRDELLHHGANANAAPIPEWFVAKQRSE